MTELPHRSSNTRLRSSLTDLPPELLDQIVASLPTCQSVAHLGQTSKRLLAYTEQNAWQIFYRTKFPSFQPSHTVSHHKEAARTLATLSRAWDRRAFIARAAEPQHEITAFPGGRRLERWKKPGGQTIGFTPHIDCCEAIGPSWKDRRQTLAFSAGAQICVREESRNVNAEGNSVSWWTYRSPSAVEGRDDVTSLHLLRSPEGDCPRHMITGTANGDLQLLGLPSDTEECSPQTEFDTGKLPVRSSSVYQFEDGQVLLAGTLGDTRVSLYSANSDESKVLPISSFDIKPPENSHRSYRAWSANFLSGDCLAVGLGPSDEPIHLYSLSPSGIEPEPTRVFNWITDDVRLDTDPAHRATTKAPITSVYPIIPLPPDTQSAASGSAEGQVFLSGAYDGVIRLHDLRSPAQVSRSYTDPINDSAIYSLLAHGQEKLVAGTSSHSLLKVFDLRLGAKAFSYLDASEQSHSKVSPSSQSDDWSLFVKPHSATYPGRGGGNNGARRSAESSIYSLASPSPHSPFIYAGIENNVIEIAFTGIGDRHPDATFFPTYQAKKKRGARHSHGSSLDEGRMAENSPYSGALNLAMHGHTADFRLCTQRSLAETSRTIGMLRREREVMNEEALMQYGLCPGLDERWNVPHASKS